MNDVDRAEPRLAAFLEARAADTSRMPTADDILDRLGGGVVRRRWRDRRVRGAWLGVALGLLALALVGVGLLGAGRRLDRDPGLLPATVPTPATARTNGWLAYVDGRSIIAITPSGAAAPRTLLTQAPGMWVDSPSWSPDGQKLTYFWGSAGDSIGSLAVFRSDDLTRQWPATGFRANPDDHQVAWSPDSSWIAVPERAGISADALGSIPVYGVDGGGMQPNQIGAGRVLYAVAWSPDGRRLAFMSTDAGRIQRAIEVFTFDSSGIYLASNHRSLVSGGNEVDLALHGWSPDSRKLLYSVRRTDNGTGQHDIEFIDADTDAMTVVSNELFDEFWPVWSPDGGRIAWQRDPGTGSTEIVVAATDGTGLRVLSTRDDAVAAGPMIWSPDGHSIVASACRGQRGCTDSMLILPVDPEGIRMEIPAGAEAPTDGPRLNFSWAAK